MSSACLSPPITSTNHPLDKYVPMMTAICHKRAVSEGPKVEVDDLLSELYLTLRQRYESYQPHLMNLTRWIQVTSVRCLGEIVAKVNGARRSWADGSRGQWQQPPSQLSAERGLNEFGESIEDDSEQSEV